MSVAIGANFLGALLGGLIAGVVCLWIARIPLPQWARGLQPVVIIPLLGSAAVGGVLYMVLGRPLSWLMDRLNDGLDSMSGGSAVALGIVLGLMMCFDLGGPLNKSAYLFATAGIASATAGDAQYQIMAAVMCAGMVPPLAMALSTVLRPGLYSDPEKENGKAAWLLGATFISEGAIPRRRVRVLRDEQLGPVPRGSSRRHRRLRAGRHRGQTILEAQQQVRRYRATADGRGLTRLRSQQPAIPH